MAKPAQVHLLSRLPEGARVLLIRLRAMGDCILLTPAMRLLKQYRADLQISVVSDPYLAEVYKGNPDVHSVLPPSITAARRFKPDLCVNFHGGVRSARLSALSGATTRAAYDMLRFQWVYNTHIPTAQQIFGEDRPVHTAEHMASAMFYLGVPFGQVPRASLYPQPGRSAHAPETPYAVIHPFASHSHKSWPFFAELAAQLHVEPIFIGASGDDLSPYSHWRTVKGAPLLETAGLVRDATLFIGNDSGPAHMAAAVDTPEVVLFGSSNSTTWAPWRNTARTLQAQGAMDTITVDNVLEAVRSL